MKARSHPVFLPISCFPAEIPGFRLFSTPICVHSRPFAVIIGFSAPPEPSERPKMDRK